jgi:hypothetical protein
MQIPLPFLKVTDEAAFDNAAVKTGIRHYDCRFIKL